jgi:predicted aldo/keto reductase-like oxidoreductase
MKKTQSPIDRRDFLKAAGSLAVGSAFAGLPDGSAYAQEQEGSADPNAPRSAKEPKVPQVPTRKLGKTDVKIPCLSFGTFQVDVSNQILLRKTLQSGVNFWDTAYNYGGGNSELGIGKFLAKNPKVRKSLFLVTKASDARTAEDVESRLKTSLKRMNTDYIDLYYGIHQCSDPARLNDEIRDWAESAKKRKLIRFFGITSHQNSALTLAAAARCDWIDAVMTPYNFRLMQDRKLQAALDACHKAKIGLIAMKVQGMGQRIRTEADKKLVEHFLKRGLTEGQAKIKLVLEDKRFASACVGMKNVKVLNDNLEIVLDKGELAESDKVALMRHAEATCSGYCAGCSHICHAAAPDAPYISDIMRYLMYFNGYGEPEEARRLFAQIPAAVRNRLLEIDYSLAEARCPRRLPIGEFVAEAVSRLA